MTVSITCYGGVNQIGGNKILVTDGDTKVFLDFGGGFSEGADFFTDWIRPRRVNGAGDLLEFGMLPNVRGLYSEEALKNAEMKYEQPLVDAVILSHYHSDHTSRVEYVDPKIPVYCGETTALLHEAYCTFGESPLREKELRTFRSGDRFTVGSIEVQPVHVDHSIPGAYGFVIFTSKGAIAYTGDFRFHGPMGFMTHEFVETAATSKPEILLSEGTRVAPKKSDREMSEEQVVSETERLLSSNEGLVFSSFRGNDVDRISSFFKACEKAGRRLVVSMKVAAMLDELRKDKNLNVPRVGKDVSVYVRRKKDGRYGGTDYFRWERPFLDNGVTAAELRKNQKGFLLHLEDAQLPELIDIRPDKGGAYIHATTEAFNEEGEQDEQVIRNWVGYFGFSYHQIHASGHAPMSQVGELVRRVGAKRVVPVHTERPELFTALTKEPVILPVKAEPIVLT